MVYISHVCSWAENYNDIANLCSISLLWDLLAVSPYCLLHPSAGWCFLAQTILKGLEYAEQQNESETRVLSSSANSMAAGGGSSGGNVLAQHSQSHSSPCQTAVCVGGSPWLQMMLVHAFPGISDACHIQHWASWHWVSVTKEAMSLSALGPQREK